jgi:hypothetical protein
LCFPPPYSIEKECAGVTKKLGRSNSNYIFKNSKVDAMILQASPLKEKGEDASYAAISVIRLLNLR